MPDREFHDPVLGVASIGPFERFPVTVNGWTVPHLEAQAHRDGSAVELRLDHRLAIDVPPEVAGKVVAFVADAIAVAKGYACHPRVDGWEREAGDPPAPTLWPWQHMVSWDAVGGEAACGARAWEPHDDPHRPPNPPSPVCDLAPGHDGRHRGRTTHGHHNWKA